MNDDAHILVISGPPASGKTTLVEKIEKLNYCRINRDQLDQPKKIARTDDCAKLLAQLYDGGYEKRFVLDNTYGTRRQRALLLQVAKDRGIPVDVKVMQTTLEQCQFLASRRMIKTYGCLMDAKEITDFEVRLEEPHPDLFRPTVISKWFKSFEPPSLEEGIRSIGEIPFHLGLGPEYTNKAIILDYDGTLRTTKSGAKSPLLPSDIRILDGRKEFLRRKQNEGWILLGVSNQPELATGSLSDKEVRECFNATNDMLGVDIHYTYCPHPAGVPQCYCRKPMPGLGVFLVEKYKLDPGRCISVGDTQTDRIFADRCGFKFAWADKFFA